MMQDTVRSSTVCQTVASDVFESRPEIAGQPAMALNWRHAATVLLLLVSFPVLLSAAVLTLPLLLVFLVVDGIRKLFELDAPLRGAASH